MRFAQNPFKIRPMEQDTQNDDVLEQLIWQVEAGADEALEEQAGMLHWQVRQASSAPVSNRGLAPEELEAALKPSQATPPMPARAATSVVDTPPEKVKATSLVELREESEAFNGCGLKQTAMNFVFATGNPDADIMVIGDAPAEDDDRQGAPFAGAHGALLDKMLASIGLDRDKVYLTNMVFWRPPGGRSPTQEEVEACQPFVQQHIRLMQPKMIVCFGGLAAKNLLRSQETFSKLRGRWYDYTAPLAETEEGIPCLATHPPAYLLRLPASKRQAWQDLLKIKERLSS